MLHEGEDRVQHLLLCWQTKVFVPNGLCVAER